MCALTRSKNRTTSCSFSGRRRHSTTSAPRPSGHGGLLVDSPTQSLLPLAGVALEGTGAHNLGVAIHLARSSTCPRPGDRQYVHVSCCATSGYHECRGTLTWSSRICPPHRCGQGVITAATHSVVVCKKDFDRIGRDPCVDLNIHRRHELPLFAPFKYERLHDNRSGLVKSLCILFGHL